MVWRFFCLHRALKSNQNRTIQHIVANGTEENRPPVHTPTCHIPENMFMTPMQLPERCSLVETTLREGEQFVHAHFTSDQRKEIAQALDAFGVEYLELTSPAASPQSARDLATIAGLGLRARVLTHTRCHLNDVKLAVENGAQGVNVLFATSEQLRHVSHGRTFEQIIEQAQEVIEYLKPHNVEIRFSCEDAFRTPLEDLLRIYDPITAMGVDRIGLADTVGIATPLQVAEVVKTVRERYSCGIEFHGHDDTGCAIANAFCAYMHGATHIDVTVLGIGERNGIAPLGGFIARLASLEPQRVEHYNLQLLPSLDHTIAQIVGVEIPFNNYITGATAFSHKAGMHTKAVLADPKSYEALDPTMFGRTRTVAMGHRLTGWHAIAERARELGIVLSEQQARAAATRIKTMADEGPLQLGDIDELLYEYVE
jgi:homocitrate synthase